MTIAEWVRLLRKVPDGYVLYLGDQELTPDMFTILDDQEIVRIEPVSGKRRVRPFPSTRPEESPNKAKG